MSQIARTEVFKVRLSNEAAYARYLTQIASKLDNIATTIRTLPKIDMGDSPASINIQTMSEATINRMTGKLEEIKNAVLTARPQAVPKVQQITGTVRLADKIQMPVFPVEKIVTALQAVEEQISNLHLEVPAQTPITFPPFPKAIGLTEGKEILTSLHAVADRLEELPKRLPEMTYPKEISINNFPPQKIPQPVTNININPLHGFVKTTAVSVGSSVIPLPGTPLAFRRSMVAYNNGAGSIYLGGSDVSATNGMIVPSGTYSPAFDVGNDMIVYAISASGTNDVRVMELSHQTIGTHITL